MDYLLQLHWFSYKGCKIAASGLVILYLGISLVSTYLQMPSFNFYLTKSTRCAKIGVIGSWQWGADILLKHILMALPIYLLMIMECTQ